MQSNGDWKKLDRQIEDDSMSGSLYFLMKEAFEGKEKGKLRTI
jgi:hypothetical protein